MTVPEPGERQAVISGIGQSQVGRRLYRSELGLLLDVDESDHVWLGVRDPRLMVDRERVQRGPTTDNLRCDIGAETSRADRRRRMDVIAARLTAQEAQEAVATRGSEELRERRDLREHAKREATVRHGRRPRSAHPSMIRTAERAAVYVEVASPTRSGAKPVIRANRARK